MEYLKELNPPYDFLKSECLVFTIDKEEMSIKY